MFKIYLDWNVMSQLKQGNHVELLDMLSNKELYQIVYSTSHISDILVSYDGTEKQNHYIHKDLDYIEKLTGGICIYNQNANIVIGYNNPKAMFEYRIETKMSSFEGDYFDKLLKDAEPGSEHYEAIIQWRDSPIPKVISDALIDPQKGELMRLEYPGLQENPTMGNLINIGVKKQKALMTTDSYGQLRTSLQSSLGLKPNALFDQINPFERLHKLHSKLNLSWPQSPNNHSPIWFQQITNNYMALDMHGYQQDRVKVSHKGRNETMRNTLEDGFHAGFATLCDYYITNDGKAYKKTKAVYEKLKINTKVYTPNEFVERYSNLGENEVDDPTQLQSMDQIMELGKIL